MVKKVMSGTIFHQPNGKTRVKSRKNPLVTLDRTNLVITLLDELTEQYDNSRLSLHFDRACTAVDFAAKTITFQNTTSTSIKRQRHWRVATAIGSVI
jgi:kynurenine 3-monooxygenase